MAPAAMLLTISSNIWENWYIHKKMNHSMTIQNYYQTAATTIWISPFGEIWFFVVHFYKIPDGTLKLIEPDKLFKILSKFQ